MKADLPFAG